MKSRKPKRSWRVTCTRHYIAVQMFDVMASTPAEAARKARRAAQKVSPDPRATATDNLWQADEPVDIPSIGSGAGDLSGQREVADGVFVFD